VPSLLREAEVYSLDLGLLLAGAKFRGDFEQRLKKVLSALTKKKEAGREPILFIDEIHTLVGAGAVGGGTLDASNLLKPALSRGELRCIGSTTFQEYRSHFEKDHALARRFQKIDVAEPTQGEAFQILQGLRPAFEKHHGVRYTDEALRAAVELSAKHITDRFLPDKAIDVMDEVGARARLKRASDEEETVIDAPQIEEAISLIARIPARSVNTSQKDRLKRLDQDLKLALFGQDHAIEALVTSIRLARSGLRSGEKPVGSFLLCGPTGVGKTELSKQLAHALGVPFLRFDMSEYSERHTVSRLIGAPPGYVGHDQAGLLTDAVNKNPHSVVLLDEIEKAHPEVWNILLQVMDHGFLTDNNGKKADFRNTILLMTSNVGSREMERRALGFGADSQPASERAHKAVEQTFSPEFRNRLDAIVYFNALDPVTIGQVVGKQLAELESQLLAKKVEILFEPEVREWLARKGYDPRLGARPLNRVIQDRLKKPLAEELLFGRLEQGGEVRVRLKGDEPEFEFLPVRSRAPESAPAQ
jgi:ATP-dependent Clp protease ATP-binding subunit ClpA